MIRALLAMTILTVNVSVVHASPSDGARKSPSITSDAGDRSDPERVTARQRPVTGKPHLVSTSHWTEMMLKNDSVYMQLTDFGLKQIEQAQESDDKDEGLFGNIVKAMALSGVKQLLNHSVALSLSDTRSAFVRDGQVVLVTCNGKEIFSKVNINGQVQRYPHEPAEEFATKINQARTKLSSCQNDQ